MPFYRSGYKGSILGTIRGATGRIARPSRSRRCRSTGLDPPGQNLQLSASVAGQLVGFRGCPCPAKVDFPVWTFHGFDENHATRRHKSDFLALLRCCLRPGSSRRSGLAPAAADRRERSAGVSRVRPIDPRQRCQSRCGHSRRRTAFRPVRTAQGAQASHPCNRVRRSTRSGRT